MRKQRDTQTQSQGYTHSQTDNNGNNTSLDPKSILFLALHCIGQDGWMTYELNVVLS